MLEGIMLTLGFEPGQLISSFPMKKQKEIKEKFIEIVKL